MAVLERIDVLSLAKIEAVLMATLGLIVGIFQAFVGTIFGALAGGAGLGLLAVIAIPILYAIFGFVGGALTAFLYNLVAGWIGGIELEFGR